MKVGSHQPTYLPHLGLFRRINNSNIMDFSGIHDKCTTGRDYYNTRVRFGVNDNFIYLNAPVIKSKFSSKMTIKEVPISLDHEHIRRTKEQIQGFCNNYKKDFKNLSSLNDIMLIMEAATSQSKPTLGDYNLQLIKNLCSALNIEVPCLATYPADNANDTLSNRIKSQITRYPNVKFYLSGNIGKTYLNLSEWEESGIEVLFDSDFAYKPHPLAEKYKGYSILCYMLSMEWSEIKEQLLESTGYSDDYFHRIGKTV